MARRQLGAQGWKEWQIDRAVRRGELVLVHSGVYAVGHLPRSPRTQWLAAVLACGPGATLSHRSAAALWELARELAGLSSTIEVTVPGRTRRARPGITVHRPRRLDAADCTRVHAIPVTSPTRTVFDLAAVTGPQELRACLRGADRRGMLDARRLRQLCEQSSGRRGPGRLRRMLAERTGVDELTRSTLERRFLRLCRETGLPTPAVNVELAGWEVDVVWPRLQLVVELDGFNFHRDRDAFERDRRRDAELQVRGFRVLRLADRQLRREPERVLEQLRILGLRRIDSA